MAAPHPTEAPADGAPRHRSLKLLARSFFVGDPVIWVIFITLMLGSIVVVFSAISREAFALEAEGGSFYGDFFKHLKLILVSFILVSVMSRVESKYYKKLAFFFLLFVIALLIYTLLFGDTVNGGKRWAEIPIIHLSVQPSEIAKVAVINYIAFCLWREKGRESLVTFLWLWTPILVTIALQVSEGITASAFLFLIALATSLIGGANKKYTGYLVLGAMALVLLVVAIKVLGPDTSDMGRTDTGQNRIERFVTKAFKPINEETYDDIMGMDYQVVLAQKAIANSNLIGRGAGQSELRQWLPEAVRDYIYNVVVEEFGLIGSLALLMTYIIFFWRCGKIATLSRSNYKSTLLYGIGVAITGQAILNMMVAANLLPVTGQTLPFISKGGSSYIFMSMFFGFALSVSREVKEERLKQDALAGGMEGMPVVDLEAIPDYAPPEEEQKPRPEV